METTLTTEKILTRDKLVEASTLIEFRFEFLAMLLDGKNTKKAAEVRKEQSWLIDLFRQIDRVLRIDRRGIHAAKPDLVKANIRQMLELLPEQERNQFIAELAQENQHANTTTLR